MNKEIGPGKVMTRYQWQSENISHYPKKFIELVKEPKGDPDVLVTLLEYTNQYIFGEVDAEQFSVTKE